MTFWPVYTDDYSSRLRDFFLLCIGIDIVVFVYSRPTKPDQTVRPSEFETNSETYILCLDFIRIKRNA